MIRPAEKADVPFMVRMLADLRDEVAPDFVFCPRTTAATVIDFIASPSKLALVAGDGFPVGFILGALGANPFSPAREAQEVGWWVDEAERGRGSGVRLFKAYEAWAVKNGASLIGASYTGKSADSFLRRQGYAPAGNTYLKKVN